MIITANQLRPPAKRDAKLIRAPVKAPGTSRALTLTEAIESTVMTRAPITISKVAVNKASTS